MSAAAEDMRLIADALGTGRFAVMGSSGGAPHALTCAALLPERTARVGTLVGLAPQDMADVNLFSAWVTLPSMYGARRSLSYGSSALTLAIAPAAENTGAGSGGGSGGGGEGGTPPSGAPSESASPSVSATS